MMGAEGGSQLTQAGPYLTAPGEKCPYYPKPIKALRSDLYTVPTAEAVFASLLGHPTGTAQPNAKRRISRDRSRLKRGPPTFLHL